MCRLFGRLVRILTGFVVAVALIILVTLILTLTPLFGVTGALTAMILAELWQLAVNYGFMLPRARRQHLALK